MTLVYGLSLNCLCFFGRKPDTCSGACEHLYCAFICEGIIRLDAPWKEASKQKKRKAGASLLPGGERQAPATPGRESLARGSYKLSQVMRDALVEFELSGFTGVFQQHHLDEDEVLHWEIKDLSALTQAPAGLLRRLVAELTRRAKAAPATIEPKAASVWSKAKEMSPAEKGLTLRRMYGTPKEVKS